MMTRLRQLATLALFLILVTNVDGQNIVVTSPFQSSNNSTFDVLGTGINFDNGNFRFNWQPNAVPPFGGYDPNNDARFGVNAGPLSLNLFGSQGSRRSLVTQTPMVTVPNGGSGYFIDAELRPFVIGYTPVVGQAPIMPPPVLQGPSIIERYVATRSLQEPESKPVKRRIEHRRATVSTAQHGDLSVAEIRRKKSASQVDAVQELVEQARLALSEHKYKVARNHLRNAALRASADQRAAIYAELDRVEAALPAKATDK